MNLFLVVLYFVGVVGFPFIDGVLSATAFTEEEDFHWKLVGLAFVWPLLLVAACVYWAARATRTVVVLAYKIPYNAGVWCRHRAEMMIWTMHRANVTRE